MKFNSRQKSPVLRRGLVSATATAALFGAGLMGFAGTAEAAPHSSAQTQVSARNASDSGVATKLTGWTFYRAYWTRSACVSEGKRGKSKGWWAAYSCNREQGNDGKMKWFLYVYNRVGG